MIDLWFTASVPASSCPEPARRVQRGIGPRGFVDTPPEVDVVALRRIGMAFTAVTAAVTMLAFVAVVSN